MQLSRSFGILLCTLLLAEAGLVAYDVVEDWAEGSSLSHLSVDIVAAFLSVGAVILIWFQNSSLLTELRETHVRLTHKNNEATEWQKKNAMLLAGLGSAIEQQLSAWGLSSSEAEIALLLLKGLSLKEIAGLRSTSERTVRQQSVAVYSKAGLSGRAELSAFFLEDLLAPPKAPDGTAVSSKQ